MGMGRYYKLKQHYGSYKWDILTRNLFCITYELVNYFDLGTIISQLALPRERDAKLYEGPFM
jgi:hypothetical protein